MVICVSVVGQGRLCQQQRLDRISGLNKSGKDVPGRRKSGDEECVFGGGVAGTWGQGGVDGPRATPRAGTRVPWPPGPQPSASSAVFP